MHDLSGSVYTRVGASCDDALDRLAEDFGQACLDGFLDGGQAWLGGPTVIIGAVIGKLEADSVDDVVVHMGQCSCCVRLLNEEPHT